MLPFPRGIFFTESLNEHIQNHLTLFKASSVLAKLPEGSPHTFTFDFPFSYDTWVHASDIDAEIEDPPIPEKPWKVRVHSSQKCSKGIMIVSEHSSLRWFVVLLHTYREEKVTGTVCRIMLKQNKASLAYL